MISFSGIRRGIGLAVAGLLVTSAPATALELFGFKLFGGDDDPAVTQTVSGERVEYEVDFSVTPEVDELEEALQSASTLISLRDRVAVDTAGLVARARSDRDRLVAALYARARYGGTVTILVAGRPPEAFQPGASLRGPVRVAVNIDAGPLFTFGTLRIRQPSFGDEAPSSEPADYGLVPGEPARSGVVIAASDALVEAWRQRGYPLAKVTSRDVIADHPRRRLDVTLVVDPGPSAVFGPVLVKGVERVDPEFVREYTGIEPGTPYDSRIVTEAVNRLRRLGVFRSVRIREAERLAPGGTLPISVEVTERKPRFIGAAASWSNIDGFEVSAYWGHRNLFGQAERFRIEGSIAQIGEGGTDDLEYDVLTTFTKPGVFDPDTDFVLETRVARERPDTYRSDLVKVEAGLLHRFSDQLSASVGIETEVSDVDDAFGRQTYALVGIPAEVVYDTRDKPLDPTEGYRIFGLFEPFYDYKNEHSFVLGEAQGTIYQSIDPDDRFILAGRLKVGSIVGAERDDIPATRRFFAGGGGSVRGYPYRGVGPRSNGEVAGGRGLFEASGEMRIRINETYGLVPFIDVGSVSSGSLPQFDDTVKVGAGLGFRYYTAFGPLRLDVAVPFSPLDGDPDVAFYVGLGQAF